MRNSLMGGIGGFAVAAGLMLGAVGFVPAAMAQSQTGASQQGTIGTPTMPGGGGSTMAQGTPGATPGTAPGTGTAAPMTAPRPAGEAGSRSQASGTPVTTTPEAGANSFTEGQARSRIEAAGYSQVSELKKDDAGVWRGKATRNGQTVDVGLDFRGNVVMGTASVAR
ncbi:hypothetical protein RQ831_14685 [Roseomonas gilardii]|uniref:PepSY domain-containing protein n=1 Tax=Roseomonas gilardii TaxID=257708 RepID=A0ABU3MJ26_9PROT|nr:hypothetical protein [Roseomonas gilardii]MDT8332305.1 hypothetical protein [Roseomonas gilardii]